MVDCEHCKHCVFDADDAYGSRKGLAFPDNCRKDRREFFDSNAEECEEFEEYIPLDEVEEWDTDFAFREEDFWEDD